MTVHLKLILHIPMKQDLNFTKWNTQTIALMSAVEVKHIDLSYDLPNMETIEELSINRSVLKAMREAILKAYPHFVGLANYKELNNLLE